MTSKTISPSYASKGNLTTGSLNRHLFRLTLPMVWGIFAIISFQLVDTWYISLLGTEPLAAMTFTFPVTYGIFSVIMGFAIAMSSVVSRQIGEGNHERVRRITTHGLMIGAATGLLLTAAGLLLKDPLFRAMGADDAMLAMVNEYMNVWFAGIALLAVPMIGNSAIRASGDTLAPALIMTVAAVLNIILDPLLIFGLFGFPRLELQGAAIATVFSNGCAMLAGLAVLHFRERMICRDGLHLEHFTDSLKRLLIIALPAGLTATIQPVTSAVIIGLLAAYGTEVVAAFGVVSRIEAFAFTIIMALATGMAPIIGQNWGAGRYDRVHATLNKAFLFAVCWSLFIAIVFILFAKPIAAAFSKTGSAEFIHTAALYFWIVSLTYAPGNLVAGWSSAFNAMGMPKRSFVMITVKYLLVLLPFTMIGSHFFGVIGIFTAMALTNLLTGTVFHFWNLRVCRDTEVPAAVPARPA